MTMARGRARGAGSGVRGRRATAGPPRHRASRPSGTTSRPPSTTGGSGEIWRFELSSSSRFCSRACRSSARLRASPELSRALGLPACS